MKGRTTGIILLLLGSVALGVIAGVANWSLFRKAVPPTMVSELNLVTARGVAAVFGVIATVILFAWGLVVAITAPIFRRK